jgi:hypothetical protein
MGGVRVCWLLSMGRLGEDEFGSSVLMKDWKA